MSDNDDQLRTINCCYKDYIWNCMALLILLINTLCYGYACMGSIVIEAIVWLLK